MAAELFDKIYGRYYYVVRRMLEAGARASLTKPTPLFCIIPTG